MQCVELVQAGQQHPINWAIKCDSFTQSLKTSTWGHAGFQKANDNREDWHPDCGNGGHCRKEFLPQS